MPPYINEFKNETLYRLLSTYIIIPQFFIFSITDDFETCQTLINMSDLYILIKLVISGQLTI